MPGRMHGGRLAAAAAMFMIATFGASHAGAQSFGRNKVQYEKFDFQVLGSEHFDIYYYPSERQAAEEMARMAERWYVRLSGLLRHQLTGRQAVILYSNHPDFEQTNVVEGELDEATGGVTESERRRVVLPMAASVADSDHVLGHELVHAFQYDILGPNAEGLPLWFIEGMAEYLSLGPRDAQTAMWLRDAAIENHLPKITDLDDPRYFPYRFGHAFWAYIGGLKGDDTIATILDALRPNGSTSRPDVREALSMISEATGQTIAQLNDAWHAAILETYGVTPSPTPKRAPDESALIAERTGSGSLNVGPALSPDGTKVAFLSERERLSIDLFLADAPSGHVIRQLIRTAADPHFESLQFLASAGTWAPDNRRLAVAAVRHGKPVLAIIDTDHGSIAQEIPVPQVDEIFQPAWSPDGSAIAFSGQVGGFTDLFVHTLSTGETRRLTTDEYSDIEPAWSPDGATLTFVTDRYRGDLASLHFSGYGLATLSVANGEMKALDVGVTGDVSNPQWTSDGKTLWFIAAPNGRSELYKFDAASGRAAAITDAPTGVAGITPKSPAISIASRAPLGAVTFFRNGGYEIQFLELSQAPETPNPADRDFAQLPPADRRASTVATALAAPTGLPAPSSIAAKPFASRFRLVDIGQEVGVSTSNPYGTSVVGGIAMTFSDILGNHVLGTAIDINGGVRDFGASATYLNRTHRWNWGVYGDRVPLASGTVSSFLGSLNGAPVVVEQTSLIRQTYEEGGGLVAYPFSRTSRVELSAGARRIGFSEELDTETFDAVSGALLDRTNQHDTIAPSLNLLDTGAAFVRDTAALGPIGPLLGERLRVDLTHTAGDLSFLETTTDLRQYAMPIRPLTLAGRAIYWGRFGSGATDDRLFPLFLGYPTLVRGYDVNSFSADECPVTTDGTCSTFDRLFGDRIFVLNLEARVPAVGLFTGKLDYGPLPVELFTFFDAGTTWSAPSRGTGGTNGRDWARSAGVGVRVNLLGFAIGEFNLARPLDRPGRGWMYVFNFRPGY